ncbi:MAG: gamma-glutamylcyclotransferase family protein [Myxococcota bacterium]
MATETQWSWYFAYGSNLDPGTFVGRRRMRPRDACVGRLDDYALVFDLPVGPGERGVANLRRTPGAHVHGVLYEIADEQAQLLDRTEGVQHGFYTRAGVAVDLEHGTKRSAFTYVSQRGVAGRKPSRRYLGLLLRGARHHGLPLDWTAWLRSLPLAIDERDPQQELPLR